MTKTLSGLQSGEFDDIDVFHTITINGEAGANNQVLTSDGDETSWKDVTIANNSVGPNQLADDAVTAAALAANSVGREPLADNAVGTVEIEAGAVTAAKIGTGAVGVETKLATSVIAVKIKDQAGGPRSLSIPANMQQSARRVWAGVTCPPVGGGAASSCETEMSWMMAARARAL